MKKRIITLASLVATAVFSTVTVNAAEDDLAPQKQLDDTYEITQIQEAKLKLKIQKENIRFRTSDISQLNKPQTIVLRSEDPIATNIVSSSTVIASSNRETKCWAHTDVSIPANEKISSVDIVRDQISAKELEIESISGNLDDGYMLKVKNSKDIKFIECRATLKGWVNSVRHSYSGRILKDGKSFNETSRISLATLKKMFNITEVTGYTHKVIDSKRPLSLPSAEQAAAEVEGHS